MTPAAKVTSTGRTSMIGEAIEWTRMSTPLGYIMYTVDGVSFGAADVVVTAVGRPVEEAIDDPVMDLVNAEVGGSRDW